MHHAVARLAAMLAATNRDARSSLRIGQPAPGVLGRRGGPSQR